MTAPSRLNVPIARHKDREVQAVAGALQNASNAARSEALAEKRALAGGELIVIAANSPVTLPHTLGRAPKWFSYCVWSSGGVVNGSVRRTDSNGETITLHNDAGVEVSIRAEVV